MMLDTMPSPVLVERLDSERIERHLRACPRLPSLSSINTALRELVNADERYTSQISEVIRRDPSLTARLLRLVNSVYYGITTPVNSIEEAVFYLGVRQIRQLAMVTPVIEEFQRIAGKTPFPWRDFWQHCIATALVTSEVVNLAAPGAEEADYVAGLVHDVGKIAMAAAFPHHFAEIQRQCAQTGASLLQTESEVLGVDHAELGAQYLRNHNLPPVLVETAQHHHQPHRAPRHRRIVAAVQVADLLTRTAELGISGNPVPPAPDEWSKCSGWRILFANLPENEQAIARANLRRCVEHMPNLVEGIV